MFSFKTMRYGRMNGILAIAAGTVFLIVNAATIKLSGYYSSATLIGGTTIFLLGLALVVFPGGAFTKRDIPKRGGASVAANELRYVWERAPVLHRVVWIVFLVAGLAGGIVLDSVLGGSLFNR